MVYQWYPGHMTKAMRMMQEDIKLIDLVIEIVDARIPLASRNPDMDKLSNGKARMILLNKADLADEKMNEAWVEYFREKGFSVVLVNSKSNQGFKVITDEIKIACAKKLERDRKRGIISRPIRAMVVGIPNVGKSTFINSFAGKACTKTGNKPGVTKGKQWIKLNKNVELLDTPGVLWPKFEDQRIGMLLAFIGSINDEIIDVSEMACNLIETLRVVKPSCFKERYDLNCDDYEKAYEILEAIAIKRNCRVKGNEPDYDKAAKIFVDDFRSGKLSRITLENP